MLLRVQNLVESRVLDDVDLGRKSERLSFVELCPKSSKRKVTLTHNNMHFIPAKSSIGNRKDNVCLQLHGQVSSQPKRCHSAMLDPNGRAFRWVSGSRYPGIFSMDFLILFPPLPKKEYQAES